MDYNSIRKIAMNKLRKISRSKKISFEEYLGNIPGIGWAGEGITFKRNRDALRKYSIIPKLIENHFNPDIETSLFGKKLEIPVMSAPMSGIKTNLSNSISELSFLRSIFKGCNKAGTIGMGGDSSDLTIKYQIPRIIKDYGSKNLGGYRFHKGRNKSLSSIN